MSEIDLSSLGAATTAAQTLGNVVLATPMPDNQYTPLPMTASPELNTSTNDLKPMLFHIEGTNEVRRHAQITDHYIEDNTAIQDHATIEPARIRTAGFIAELNNVPSALLAQLQTVATKLQVLTAYTPGLTIAAEVAYNEAFRANAAANLVQAAAVSKWNWQTTQAQNRQQAAFLKWEGYFMERRMFKVQTPWRIYPLCLIEDLVAVQDESTRLITQFEVVFKEIRYAKTKSVSFSQVGQGRFNEQLGPAIDNGTQTPPSSKALADSLIPAFGGKL